MHLLSLLLAFAPALSGVMAATPYKVQTPPLTTPWTYEVGTNPWPDHPRPQLHRDAWQSLNGIWTWEPAASNSTSNPPDGPLAHEIMVPSCVESGLSGIQQLNVTNMWYSTTFDVPSSWSGQSVVLSFEAVDYQATVFVNGKEVKSHTGGYFRFTVDITEHLISSKSNSLVVFVFDPTDSEVIPVGKQTRTPSHIFYRPCSGIWQTVWLQAAPKDHIVNLDVAADMNGKVSVTAHSSEKSGAAVKISVVNKSGTEIATAQGKADEEFDFTVHKPDLWSPDSPTLYNLTLDMGGDTVHSYTGFRTISSGMVNGVQRPLLNGEFIFMFGTLDQGFWPDGIYLAPNRDAMVHDLTMLKNLGFNMLRKHIKAEPDLYYQACDEMGIMLIQDMPSLPSSSQPDPAEQAEFQRQFTLLLNEHKSYTSIVTWIIYNEGWGQLTQPPWPEQGLTKLANQLDGTRLVDSVTGWYDHGYGDFSDNHHYANPQCGSPFYSINSPPYDPSRIGIQGEFAGIGNNVSIEHLWNVEEAILTINQTYELNQNLDAWNYRAGVLFGELRDQIEMYACSGGIWTQTSDVEGEVNGLTTYDRRIVRPDVKKWQGYIQSLYQAAQKRGGRSV